MKYYMAPMEGLTGYIYRNAYHHHFAQMDKYFAPFIVASSNRKMNHREMNDLRPEHNRDLVLIPQILANKADDFLTTASNLWEMGYEEINLNLGCPSKTVVSKYKGSGFLEKTVELERFLDRILNKMNGVLSVKTRIGRYEADEFYTLMNIFNKFPLEELIIHPRVQTDYYENTPDMDTFQMGYHSSNAKVCYNGDVFTADRGKEVLNQFPNLNSIMLGRGVIRNPELRGLLMEAPLINNPREISNKWRSFHQEVFSGYEETLYGERPLLFKMKEIWEEWGKSFENQNHILKKIRKTTSKEEYSILVKQIFDEFFHE